ncbi:DUF637 domain-containing protein [Devosia alba]|uniref:two-partner secretion domain-containing protein n=1 Tax=Devosia alba TaxID=3152360 RepID=UPI0032671C50
MSLLVAAQPTLVIAQQIQIDSAAATSNQATIDAAGNGVPIINIVAPNAAGLSHNKYSNFNVGAPGAILNNSNQSLGQSQLGGFVQGNTNLTTSGPASVILNEVTSANRSSLNGMLEVHGAAAGVVIANPNGITCDGCGFINTPRVTLSTGTPELGAGGALSNLRVEGGDVLIGLSGANLGAVSVFDIVSRKISVGGPVLAGDQLNLVAGRNSYAYQSGLITPMVSDGGEPAIAIDSSLVGGMYAGQIKLVSTDQGAGVRMQGQMAANAQGMTLTASGKLVLGKVQSNGKLRAQSTQSTVEVQSTLFSGQAIELEGLTAVELKAGALVASQGDLSLKAETVKLEQGALAAAGVNINGVQTATGTLDVRATTLDAGNGQLAAGADLVINADSINLERGIDDGTDSLRSLGQIALTTNNLAGSNARISSADGLALSSANALAVVGGTFASGGNLRVEAASVDLNADITASGTLTVRGVAGHVVNQGRLASDAATSLVAASIISNSGDILSQTALSLNSGGTVTNSASGKIVSNGTVVLSNGAVVNHGQIGAQGGPLELNVAGALDNSGTLLSTSSASFGVDGSITNSGNILVEDGLQIQGSTGARAGSFENTSIGTINAGTLSLAVAHLNNVGTLTAHDAALSSDVSGNVANSGTINAKTLVDLAVGGNVTNSGSMVAEQTIALAGLAGGYLATLTNAAGGAINGGTGLAVMAAALTNQGAAGAANGAVDVALTGALNNTGLLYSGGSSRYRLDGAFTNISADIIAETELTIEGLSGPRAGAVRNVSGNIEAVVGPLVVRSASLANERLQLSVGSAAPTSTSSGNTTYTTTQEVVTANSAAAKLLSGGSMIIETGSLTNGYSQIAANGDITISASSVTNMGRDLIRTVVTTTTTQHSNTYCAGWFLWFCTGNQTDYWTTSESSTSSSTTGAVFGTIEAGGTLTANVSGYVSNNAVRSAANQIGLASGARALNAANVSATSGANSLVALSNLNVSVDSLLNRTALFDAPTAPNAPYLIETRSEFIDRSKFLGSDYFLSRATGYDPSIIAKLLGDSYVETRFVQDQVFTLTGQRYLGPVSNSQDLMKMLFDNALVEQQRLGLSVGVALTSSQIAGLTRDIVWLEKQIVQGQEVLLPRVYLSTMTASNVDFASAQIRAGQVDVATGSLINSGNLFSLGNLRVSATDAVINRGGSLFAGADIVIDSKGLFANISGTVSGDDVTLVAGSVINDTEATRDLYANGFSDRQQQTARIEARNDLVVSAIGADGSINATGGAFVAGNEARLTATGDVTIEALRLDSARQENIKGGYDRSASGVHTLATVQSGGDLQVTSGGDILMRGVSVEAGGDATLEAIGDVEIASVQDYRNEELKLELHGSGLFGTGLFGSKINIDRQQSTTETRRTEANVGGDLVIRANVGDITLDAAKLDVVGETLLDAQNGQVALLTDTDNTYSSDFYRDEGLLWWSQQDQGSSTDNVIHTLIESGGGLTITTSDGVVVEYRETGDLNASIDQLSKLDGLAWMDQVRQQGDGQWQAVAQAEQSWNYQDQGLTQAGAALVALVVSIATQGVGSGFASGLGFAQGTIVSAAMEAGITSLATQASIALINNQGDLGATLADLGSDATLRALVGSMLTAGLTQGVLNVAQIGAVTPGASLGQNFANAAQRNLIKAAIKIGVQTTVEGQPLDQSLISALRLTAADTLGASVATEIGKAVHGNQIHTAAQLIAHAALGCATGAIGAGDCAGGATGAVAGEVAAQVMLANWTKQQITSLSDGSRSWTPAEVSGELARLRTEFQTLKAQGVNVAALAGGLAALFVGGDVNTGAMAGGNAAGNNTFAEAGAITGCAVGAPAAGVGCAPGAAAGALVGLGIDVTIAILIAAGVYIIADEVMNEADDGDSPWPSNGGPPLDGEEAPGNGQDPNDPNGTTTVLVLAGIGWTATNSASSEQNALRHWMDHGAEFPEFSTVQQYVQSTQSFVTNPPGGTLTKVRPGGDIVFYDPATNTFAVKSANGAPRTMFRPAPRSPSNPNGYNPNLYSSPLEYFHAQ